MSRTGSLLYEGFAEVPFYVRVNIVGAIDEGMAESFVHGEAFPTQRSYPFRYLTDLDNPLPLNLSTSLIGF